MYFSLLVGICLIILTKILIQTFKISNLWALLSQVGASWVILSTQNLEVRFITYNIENQIELSFLAIPFTVLFLVGMTNVMDINKEQNTSILLITCGSLISISLTGYIIGHSFIFKTGLLVSLVIILILLYGYISGRKYVGVTLNTSIGFIIAVLSLNLIKFSIVYIYIPLFVFALPITLFYLLKTKTTKERSLSFSFISIIMFSGLLFIASIDLLGYLVLGLTLIWVITQISTKYRYI